MTAEIITGAEIAIRCLQKENVKFVFGYPGGAVLNIYDAIFQQKSFKHVLVRTSKQPFMRQTLTQGQLVMLV